MISLTYSMDSGTNSSAILLHPGTVQAPRLDCYYSGRSEQNCTNPPQAAPETSQSIAHAYGEVGIGYSPCDYTNDEDIKVCLMQLIASASTLDVVISTSSCLKTRTA